MKKLEGLEWTPMWTTHLGCLHGCAEYLGLSLSPEWLFGATGHAFVINVHDVLCPSGPTAWDTRMLCELSPNVGISQSMVCGWRGRDDIPELQRKAWEFLRSNIDAGNPCYGWELEVPEFYVIYGYDDTGYHFSGPLCDHGKGPRAWDTLGDTEIGLIEMYACQKCDPAPVEKTVRDALDAALKHADNSEGWIMDKYRSGIDGFRVWRESLEKENDLPWGVAYNTKVWSECRYFASKFLEEAAGKLSGDPSTGLQRAAELYRRSHRELERVSEIYPFKGPEQNPKVSAEGRKAAIESLASAGRIESDSLQLLRDVLEVL